MIRKREGTSLTNMTLISRNFVHFVGADILPFVKISINPGSGSRMAKITRPIGYGDVIKNNFGFSAIN